MRTLMLLSAFCFAFAGGGGQDEPKPKLPFVDWSESAAFKNDNDPHDPLVFKGKVIVGTDRGELIAFECKDGVVIGTRHYGDRIYYAPTTDGRHIYFTSASGLRAVDPDNGALIWDLPVAACDGPTITVGKLGLVYVGGNDGNLYAVDAGTGKQKWTAEFMSDALPDRPKFEGAKARMNNTRARPSALATDGDSVFLSVFDQSRLVAFRASDGKRLWSFHADGWVAGEAVATQKHVFVGSQDESFYCLDKQTGQKLWSFKTKWRIESGGSVDDKFVYFGSCDGGLYCLNQLDGKQQWRFVADKQNGRASAIYSVPVLRGDSVFFAAGEGQVYAVDRRSGKLQWKIRPTEHGDLYCSLATDGKRLFGVARASARGRGEAVLFAIGEK